MMEMSARQTGITLIESIVVIAIIGIISCLAAPSFQWLREIAEQKQVIQQLHAAVLTARRETAGKRCAWVGHECCRDHIHHHHTQNATLRRKL